MKTLEDFIQHPSFSKMQEGARLLLEGLGEVTATDQLRTKNKLPSSINLKDPNFKKTPFRIAKTYLEMNIGLGMTKEIKNIFSTSFPSKYSGMILVNSIDAHSMCPHHFLPVIYQIHFAYIPNKIMLGLSKIPRFIKLLSKQPILQEDLTKDIIGIFNSYVHPLGAMVVVIGVHNCMVCRGVETINSSATTSEIYGSFEQQETRAEFSALLNLRLK